MQIQAQVIVPPKPLRYPIAYRRCPRVNVASQYEFFRRNLHLGSGNDNLVRHLDALTTRLPAGAEDWFVIPKPEVIASSFAEATLLMMRLSGIETRHISTGGLEQTKRTREALTVFNQFQRWKFWVIPAQFGFSHGGKAMEEVRTGYAKSEFGLDLYLVSACLASHRERLTGGEDELGIDCPGNADLDCLGSSKAPCLNSFLGRLRCLLNWVEERNPRYGSATGFIPGYSLVSR